MCCKENKCFAAFVLVGIYAPTRILLYIEGYSFGKTTKEGGFMVIKIDFQSIDLVFFYGKTQVIDSYVVAIAFHQVFNLYQCSFLLVS